eukprot:3132475-Pyramimonas_sp.AAC.1
MSSAGSSERGCFARLLDVVADSASAPSSESPPLMLSWSLRSWRCRSPNSAAVCCSSPNCS